MDTIADFLTRIRNALMAKHRYVDVSHSKMVESMSKLLFQKGMILNLLVSEKKVKKVIRIFLKYDRNRKGVIQGLKQISKPGSRVYAKSKKIPFVMDGFGFAMISTSEGIIDDVTARRKRRGGEVICTIW